MKTDMKLGVQDYVNFLTTDYSTSLGDRPIDKQMLQFFSVTHEKNSKRDLLIVKVQGAPHSIIVLKPMGKFNVGDILRPAMKNGKNRKNKPELDFVRWVYLNCI